MNLHRSALATSLCFMLSACGGSGDTPQPQTINVPEPAPSPAPIPAPTLSNGEGVFSGQASLASDGSSMEVLGVISTDDQGVLVLGNQGEMLKVDLSKDSDGNISGEGVNYTGNGKSAQTIEIRGTGDSTGYQLEIFRDGEKQYDVSLSKDDSMSNSQPVADGYYELDSAVFERMGVVIYEGNFQGNDTDQCKYSGSVTPLANNVFDVTLDVSSIEPFDCPHKGEFEGYASVLNNDGEQNNQQELWVAVHNDQQAIVRALSKISDEPVFKHFPAGIYYQDSSSEFEDISFAVSHDGLMRGSVVTKLFAGYFDAQPDYMGKGYTAYDDNVLYYDRGAWITVKGNLAISDVDWERLFEQPSSQVTERTYGDFTEIYMGVIEEPVYSGNTSMAIRRKERADFPIQFSDLVGRYIVESANIDLTIDADGDISGKHHGCDMAGKISERTDTPAQEFSVFFTRSNCSASNNFSLDGPYEGFGFATNYADQGYFELELFVSGVTSKGVITNLLSLSSLSK